MSYCTKYNRKTGEYEIVPPPRIDPMAWPFIIFFGALALVMVGGAIAGFVIAIGNL